jgi:DNA-binding transcriptional LysR family regulator
MMNLADLNLRHLRLFVQICETGSLNRVAEISAVSQPAISVAMAKLEARFGSALLSRHPSGSLPTPAGLVLLNRLRRMEGQIAAATGQALGAAARRNPGAAAQVMERITMRQILAFIALSESGSIVQAARTENSAPATLHRLLHDLQGHVGRAIFGRGPAGMTPNAAGQRLALGWRVALTELEQAHDELKELEGRMEGRVKVASLPLARTRLLARALNPFLADHPNARVEIVDGPYDVLARLLRAGGCDILIGALRSGRNLEALRVEALFEDPYSIVCRAGHPLLKLGRSVEFSDLAAMEWVAQRPGAPIRAAFDALFKGGSMNPKASVETSSLVLTRALILESDRLSMLSRRQIAVEDETKLLCCPPLSGDVQKCMGNRTIGFTVRENWLPSRLQSAFIDRLRAAATLLDLPPGSSLAVM